MTIMFNISQEVGTILNELKLINNKYVYMHKYILQFNTSRRM